jgi:outer membrane protein assembly factor BamD
MFVVGFSPLVQGSPVGWSSEIRITKGVDVSEDKQVSITSPSDLLFEAYQFRGEGKLKKALKICKIISRRFPRSGEAPQALQLCGEIYLQQKRFQRAFTVFKKIPEKYPDYVGYGNVIAFEFEVAQRLMDGQRNYFFGKIPGMRDRESAIRFFQTIVDQAPYSPYAPQALFHIATLGIRTKDLSITVGALERLIDEYAMSEYAPMAHLLLAQTYRKMVPGPDYDQKAAEDALNYFREFLILYADSPLADSAQAGLDETEDLLARSKLSMGNFYYDNRQNPIAAAAYYKEVLASADESDAAAYAQKRLDDIAAGKYGKGSPIDFLIGRYRSPASPSTAGEEVPSAVE